MSGTGDISISLYQTEWQILDDAEWTDQWVGISSGDIYREEVPIGHYLAAWYPNTNKPAQLLVTAVKEDPASPLKVESLLSVAFTCLPGDPDSLIPVEADAVPWDADGIIGPILSPTDIDGHVRAREIVSYANEILSQDLGLYKYVCDPSFKITED